MKKRDVWACEHGCDLSAVACEHLEALLPQMGHKKLPLVDNDRTVTFDPLRVESFDPEEFAAFLKKYGVHNDFDVELLVNRFVHRLSKNQLVKEEGYTSRGMVERRLTALKEQLRPLMYRFVADRILAEWGKSRSDE